MAQVIFFLKSSKLFCVTIVIRRFGNRESDLRKKSHTIIVNSVAMHKSFALLYFSFQYVSDNMFLLICLQGVTGKDFNLQQHIHVVRTSLLCPSNQQMRDCQLNDFVTQSIHIAINDFYKHQTFVLPRSSTNNLKSVSMLTR